MKNVNLLIRHSEAAAHVAPSQIVTTPHGRFETWKIDAVDAHGKKVTLWIDKETYRHVDVSALHTSR